MSDDQKDELLAKAAAAAGAPEGIGDVPGWLQAYYRHVPAEDIAAVAPERLAALAARHAALAARRPPGQALIDVRPGDGSVARPPADVIDIVTDDMPFLVDSTTMELARHSLAARLIVHPQLRVRRDPAGTLQTVSGPVNGEKAGPGEIAESWTHLEIPPLAQGEPAVLAADLDRVLRDVRVAVEDYPRMRAKALWLAESVLTETGSAQDWEVAELFRWLTEAHFTFLGYREYDLTSVDARTALTAVPGSGLGILRRDQVGSGSFARLPEELKARALQPRRLIVTKANSRATVHRPSYLDYVAVQRWSPDGRPTGEYRFLGLFTHSATAQRVKFVPVLRQKLAEVLDLAGLAADSHDGKDVAEVLDSYPREELFSVPAADLVAITAGVNTASQRRQTRLFLRRDRYDRYVSCLVYLPRDRYTTPVRLAVERILRQAFGGTHSDYDVQVGDSPLAQFHIVVRGRRGARLPHADAAALERQVAAAVRSWDDDLADEAAAVLGPQHARAFLAVVGNSIPPTYKADVPASAAIDDLTRIADMRSSGRTVDFELWESQSYTGGVPIEDGDEDDPASEPGRRVWRLTIYSTAGPITLTDVLPRLQHMGVDVVDEHPYEFPGPDGPAGSATAGGATAGGVTARWPVPPFWIYDFGLRRKPVRVSAGVADADLIASQQVRQHVEDALGALWDGRIEDDSFNGLVLDAQLTWRQATLLRAFARYLRQAKLAFSQEYIAGVLRANGGIARLLVTLFESRFDPARASGREERSEALAQQIRGALEGVARLDEDRILRAYLGLIQATLRTNYYRGTPESVPYLVVKLSPREVPGLAPPWPRYELFAYSPRFEGVHLRFAPVARGGLRFSDRREDFRTEILDLAKAQEVKNSVIVPSGAKGGFVCKQLPDPGDRDGYAAEVLACYRMFVSAMLDVTDNLSGGQVVPPDQVVRHDGDDPYLVVAADKGTATFSDTANEIALARGFWLGDAFASGGSEGYDHKKIGITARGAWESVRYHFRTLGLDVDDQDFTVAGIGDMSGDVFGNGMLLSPHIKLVAAFDHRHVFIDPSPDPAASMAERRRLFDLPRSSWADYDTSLISAGGGIWPRSAKSIPLSPQAGEALGLGRDAPAAPDSLAALPPDAVISAILSAPVDLLWNGGIGTYVKASAQSHADVGDRANDAVRIDAPALRARVVGEGGNLGLTQQARVEYALAGGKVCTDFIDNSAGVDTSDHEVNIKILLDREVSAGRLPAGERGALLQQMTGDVAAHVLRHNYLQNRVLAAAEFQAPVMLHVHARYIRQLEAAGRIRRRADALPTDRELAERRSAGRGLVVPEYAVLLAHTKIAATAAVLASGLPDDPYLRRVLIDYFPSAVAARFGGAQGADAGGMNEHPLRREIITTSVVNDMVDRSGITFAFRMEEETGASVPEITAAWLVAREVFEMPAFWAQVEALDGQVAPGAQILAMLEGRKLTERAARWLLAFRRPPFDIQAAIDFFEPGVRAIAAGLPGQLAGRDLAGFGERREFYASRGVPAELAGHLAAMVPSYSAFDIVEIAHGTGRPVTETAEVYFDLADRLDIARLRDLITALPREDRWTTMARAAVRDDLYTAHAALTRDVLTVTEKGSPEQRLAAWAARNEAAVRRATQTLAEIWESNEFTVATLSVAVRAVRTLVTAAALPA